MEDQLNSEKFYNNDAALDQSNGGQLYSIESPTESHNHNGSNSNNSSGNFGGAAAAANGVSNAESEQMKIFVTNPNVTYHTRHARRIYVGGIPPNYSDEEELRNFFNKVISKGMDVENDNSYVISVYMNQKKCYAFVEFNSIELTTACLEMDGIIFKKVTLKIYRANEYRPELVPPTKYIKLDLTGWSFGLATGAGAAGAAGMPSMHQQQQSGFMGRPDRNNNTSNNNGSGSGLIAPHPSWVVEDTMNSASPSFQSETLASLIQFTNIASMEPGSLAIVGFPYESNAAPAKPINSLTASGQRPPQRGVGTATAPTALRKSLSAYPFGAIYNAELGLDLVLQPIVDVGDVLAGQSRGETKALLSTTVSELLLRGSVPFLVGGSRDQTYYSALGLVAAAGVCVGVMNVSAQVDSKILDCPEFCSPSSQMSPAHLRSTISSPARNQNCYGRYVQFGAQGSQCNGEVAKSIVERGGHVFWLHKDLRTASTESVAVAQFTRALRNLDACVTHDQQRKGVNTAALRASYPQAHIMVTVDCGVLAAAFNPHGGSSHSSVGLTAEEVLEIAFLAGAHPNVALFELTEFRPDQEGSESRLNMFLADVFYKFTLGVASRSQPVRGGVLGSGAAAVLSHGQATSNSLNGSPASLVGAYNRPVAGVNGTGKGNTGRIAVPYVPESTVPRYTPSRDPAVILQQQQAAQQAQQQAHAQQQALLGRGPYTPQQLQVQQQQMLHAQNAGRAQRGMTPFPTIPENAAVNSSRPPLKHFGSGSAFSLHEQDDQGPGQGSGQGQNGGYEQAHLSPADRGQRNSLGSFSDVLDDATLPAAYGSALLSRSGNLATARQASQSFTEGMYPSGHNNNNNNNNNGSNLRGNHNSNNSGNGQGQGHYQPQQHNSPGQSNSQALQQQQQQSGGGGAPGMPNLSNLNISTSPWLYANPPSSYHGATPTNTNNASTGYTASSDWLNPNLSRMSSHSTSTMSMLGAFHSTSSNLHTNSFNNSSHSLSGSSFALSGNNYDDSMDKLIGVTNIGLVPAFDDPQDPLYSED